MSTTELACTIAIINEFSFIILPYEIINNSTFDASSPLYYLAWRF